ncbi:MAG TPA: YceI family protein [Pyrinomonadaceae bacterium]|nr:YceI family protein [Pyrinomonadaceae bacterium]
MRFVVSAILALGFSSLVPFSEARVTQDSAKLSPERSSALVRYRIDSAQSKFMVVAPRGGLAWFKGHSHYIAVRDFEGDAELTLDAVTPASLQMTVHAASLEETGADFTPEQKATIKKELNEIVLETAKYPDITFKSTDVKGAVKNGAFDVEITGDLTLHGVTRRIEIPSTVTVTGDTIHAVGKFDINRKKFNVNATNAFHGFVRVKHGLKFSFDIIGQKV